MLEFILKDKTREVLIKKYLKRKKGRNGKKMQLKIEKFKRNLSRKIIIKKPFIKMKLKPSSSKM